MPFGAVLAQVGALGRFQVLQTALLAVPILLMASHNLLQNFTAAVPPHRCRRPAPAPAPAATPRPPGPTPDGTAAAYGGTSTASGVIPRALGGTLGSPGANLGSPGANLGSHDGNLRSQDGTLGSYDGNLRSHNGNLRSQDGTRIPGGTNVNLDGTLMPSDAIPRALGGTLGSPGANLGSHDGNLGSPDGTLGSYDGNLRSQDGNLRSQDGTRIPGGTNVNRDGTSTASGAIPRALGGTLGSPGANLGSPGANLGSHDGNLGSPDGTLGSYDGNLRSHDGNLRSHDGTRIPGGTNVNLDGTLTSFDGIRRALGGTLGSPSATSGSPGATLGSPNGNLGSHDGNLRSHDGNLGSHDGTRIPGGTHVNLDGTLMSSNAIPRSLGGTSGSPGATLGSPDGNSGSPDGHLGSPDGTHIPGGTHVTHDGTLTSSNGTLGPAGGTLGWSNGTLGVPDATLGSCRRYVASSPANGSTDPRPTEPCHDGWDYDRSVYVATIVTEWDLVCGYRQLRQMAQSIYMAGVLVGALVLGGLSDRFGRKAMLMWSYLQLGVMGTCTAFAPNYASYCLFRFAGGMALSGFGLSIACLVVEWIPTPYRAITVAITGFAYTLGQILLAGVAYAVPHWRWLQLTVSLPFFVFLLYSWWLAESARWLVLSGKAERAVKVLQRVAKINKRKEEGEKITVEILRSNMKEELAALKSSYTISDLVRTPVIRHIFFCLSIVWFSISFSYYGLAMDLQNFGVSIYLIQVIFGAVDFPAKVVVTVSLSYIGRRVSLMVTLFLAGLVIIANIFVSTELQTVRTALAVIGKGCLSASFNCVFLYTTELYPTPIRQTGLGFGSTMARVGGIVAPLVKMMDEYYPFLPPAVYGVAPVVAAVAAGFLPETLNTPLPDTIEEVESRAKRKKTDDPKEKIPLQPQAKAPQREA